MRPTAQPERMSVGPPNDRPVEVQDLEGARELATRSVEFQVGSGQTDTARHGRRERPPGYGMLPLRRWTLLCA